MTRSVLVDVNFEREVKSTFDVSDKFDINCEFDVNHFFDGNACLTSVTSTTNLSSI